MCYDLLPLRNLVWSTLIGRTVVRTQKDLLGVPGPNFCDVVSSTGRKMWVRGRPVVDRVNKLQESGQWCPWCY